MHEEAEPDDKDKNNIHKWTIFVRIKNEDLMEKCSLFITKVRWELHENYTPPIIETEAEDGKQFELTKQGYGTFQIPITIFWQPETGLAPLTVYHMLDFKGNEKSKDFEFEISESFMKSV